MFHSQSSLSKFLSFKTHLANLELSPVEPYQIFDFVNFRLDGRPCFLQTNIKTPPWAFCISPVISSMKWEMWTSHIWWWKRIQRKKMFRALVRTLMAPEKAPVWASGVTTDGKHQQSHNNHNNQAGLGSHVPDQIPWSSQLEQNQEEYCYFHQCLEMSHWQQFSRQYVMFKSSICFTNLSSKLRKSLLSLIVMTSYLSWPPKLSTFLYLSLWTAVYKIATLSRSPLTLLQTVAKEACGRTTTLYLADTSAVQSPRSWGLITVIILLL